MRIKLLALPFFSSLLGAAASSTAQAQSCQQVTELASVAPSGMAANSLSANVRISADGRHVVFLSYATDLAPGDPGVYTQLYWRDRGTGDTAAVSVRADGDYGVGDSSSASVSDDGRMVAFVSEAANLVANDLNGLRDVFVKDMQTGSVQVVSVSTFGVQSDSHCADPALSGNGRFVAFRSEATTLAGVPDPGESDVFVRDLLLGTTEIVSLSSQGAWGTGACFAPDISGDGRYVAFMSWSSTLVSGDTNSLPDIFVRDRQLGTTELVSVTVSGAPSNGFAYEPSISDDGQRVAFLSTATDLGGLLVFDLNQELDVYLRDRTAGTTALVSRAPGLLKTAGNDECLFPRISGDGRFVAFTSYASDLVAGDLNGAVDVFVRDTLLDVTTRTSVGMSGGETLGAYEGDISRDGLWTAWQSLDSTIVFGDTNGFADVFVRGLDCSFPEDYCTAKVTSNGCVPAMSSSGEPVADLSGNFKIFCQSAINQKPGQLFYGLSGRAALPFQGGTLCVMPPTKRGPIQFSGGNVGPSDCSGLFLIDMDAYASGALGGSPLPALQVAGTVVNAQWWSRDPGYAFPQNTQLSNALEYTVRP